MSKSALNCFRPGVILAASAPSELRPLQFQDNQVTGLSQQAMRQSGFSSQAGFGPALVAHDFQPGVFTSWGSVETFDLLPRIARISLNYLLCFMSIRIIRGRMVMLPQVLYAPLPARQAGARCDPVPAPLLKRSMLC